MLECRLARNATPRVESNMHLNIHRLSFFFLPFQTSLFHETRGAFMNEIASQHPDSRARRSFFEFIMTRVLENWQIKENIQFFGIPQISEREPSAAAAAHRLRGRGVLHGDDGHTVGLRERRSLLQSHVNPATGIPRRVHLRLDPGHTDNLHGRVIFFDFGLWETSWRDRNADIFRENVYFLHRRVHVNFSEPLFWEED